ncbi:hypothetical protein OUZ56_018324 [Daphnia magna]|nr:hypothetical protein OUZ56_018324 [Daphnia magna]
MEYEEEDIALERIFDEEELNDTHDHYDIDDTTYTFRTTDSSFIINSYELFKICFKNGVLVMATKKAKNG